MAYDLKISARTNHILYNRIGDEVVDLNPDPETGYPVTGGGEGIISITNGSLTYLIGNTIIKGFSAAQDKSFEFMLGGNVYSGYNPMAYVLYNTFIAQRQGSQIIVNIGSGAMPALVADNFYVTYNGNDQVYTANIQQYPALYTDLNLYEHQGSDQEYIDNIGMVNYEPSLAVPWLNPDLVSTSLAIDYASTNNGVPGTGGWVPAAGMDDFPLTPTKQYVQTSATAWPSHVNRSSCNCVGAFEYNNNPSIHELPTVFAGPSLPPTSPKPGFSQRAVATDDGALMGAVDDDGKSGLSLQWTKVSGPGGVTFATENEVQTLADFDVPGVYTLRLTATNGEGSSSADVTVQAEIAPAITVTSTAQDLTAAYDGTGATFNLAATVVDADNGPTALSVPGNTNWNPAADMSLELAPSWIWTPNNGADYPMPTTLSPQFRVNFTMPTDGSDATFVLKLTSNDGAVCVQKPVILTVPGAPPTPKPVVDTTTAPAFVYEGMQRR